MRALRPAESSVIQSVLSGTEAEAGTRRLPRRTRQTVRRRLSDRGWFREAFLPDISLFGWSHLEFALIEPFAENRVATLRALASIGSVGVLWSGASVLFAVYASTQGAGSATMPHLLERVGRVRSMWTLAADPADRGVPVYFDFEAAWVRRWGLVASRRYPQAFPGAREALRGREEGLPTAAELRLVRALVAQEPAPGRNGRSNGRAPPAEAAVERCIRSGWVRRRSLLNPVAASRWIRGFPPQVAFLRATLNTGVEGQVPLQGLVTECGVGPFLYATDDREVLIGTLAMGPGLRREVAEARWAPVLPTLRRSLHEIVLIREPLESLRVDLDHDYRGLLDGPSPPAL